MKIFCYTSLLAFVLCFACGTDEGKSGASESKTEVAIHQTDTSATAGEADPANSTVADDEIRETGRIKEVEDSGYPIATLTIEFPERHFQEYFAVNLEEVKGATINDLPKWVGRYISFSYTSELTNALLDVQLDGKSLVNADNTGVTAETKKVSGILKGADEETPGDLPDKVTITTTDNTVFEFEFFVTKEMVEANGKSVEGFYDERTRNVIKSLKLLPK